jgi:hypothetical protein
MPIIDSSAILKEISEKTDRMRALGVSEDRERAYYEQLSGPDEFRDEARDDQAFNSAISGLYLSEAERAFVQATLDSGDGR